MKRGAIPTIDSFQQWKKQQLEDAERDRESIMEEKVNKTREYIAKNVGRSLDWGDTELVEPKAKDSASHRALLKEFASLGYNVWLPFSDGLCIVPDFVFEWDDLLSITIDYRFKVTLPEKSAV